MAGLTSSSPPSEAFPLYLNTAENFFSPTSHQTKLGYPTVMMNK
jgi:hypothetical protein